MKVAKKILLIIGCIFVFANIYIYTVNQTLIPSFNTKMDPITSFIKFSGEMIGFNLIGLLGLILIAFSIRK
jgi:hypothetical protein